MLTFISVGAVIVGVGVGRHIAPLDALLVPLTTLPIAWRRYRPLTVVAVAVSAETLLLFFSHRVQVPLA